MTSGKKKRKRYLKTIKKKKETKQTPCYWIFNDVLSDLVSFHHVQICVTSSKGTGLSRSCIPAKLGLQGMQSLADPSRWFPVNVIALCFMP